MRAFPTIPTVEDVHSNHRVYGQRDDKEQDRIDHRSEGRHVGAEDTSHILWMRALSEILKSARLSRSKALTRSHLISLARTTIHDASRKQVREPYCKFNLHASSRASHDEDSPSLLKIRTIRKTRRRRSTASPLPALFMRTYTASRTDTTTMTRSKMLQELPKKSQNQLPYCPHQHAGSQYLPPNTNAQMHARTHHAYADTPCSAAAQRGR